MQLVTIAPQDGNGFINRMELRHVMMNLGEKMTEVECDALVDVSHFPLSMSGLGLGAAQQRRDPSLADRQASL